MSTDKWTIDDEAISADTGGTYHFVCSYPFTAPARAVHFNDTALHVLTDRGLETYTLRTGHRLFGSPYEYARAPARLPQHRESQPQQQHQTQSSAATVGQLQRCDQEACPSADDPVSLIGLQPFLHVHSMHGSDQALVLLAVAPQKPTAVATERGRTQQPPQSRRPQKRHHKVLPAVATAAAYPNATVVGDAAADQSEVVRNIAWTAYRLRLPDARQLVGDLLELADQHRHRRDAASTYALLIAEAHMVARVGREWARIVRYVNAVRLRWSEMATESRLQQQQQHAGGKRGGIQRAQHMQNRQSQRRGGQSGTKSASKQMAKDGTLERTADDENGLDLEALYGETCLRLGDYCVCSATREEYCQVRVGCHHIIFKYFIR